MSSPKERRKLRRRVEKQMDQAWQAVAAGNLVLAEKLSRRAVDAGHVNPRIWNDHGLIMQRCGDGDAAEAAFRMAIALAPTYAGAFAHLASLQAERGKLEQAERLQRRAVELKPDPDAVEVLRSYRALVARREPPADAAPAAAASFTARTARYDWEALQTELRRRGVVRLPALLTPEECAALIALDADDSRFEHDVERDDPEFGRLRYRFFRSPLPELIAAIRAEVYARAAPIANAWNAELGRTDRLPAVLDEFLDRCHRAGQHRSTPILLHYTAGGFNAPHRDISGSVVFPLQLAITLGPDVDQPGGEFLLYDDRPGKKQTAWVVPTSAGDGVLFCTRERWVEIGGAAGLQPVRHGVAEVRAPERYALGVPFHEHG